MHLARPSPRSARVFVSAPRTPPRRPARGFTILELLIALAIIGMVVTALLRGSANLLGERASTPDDAFDKAVQECRKAALKDGKEIHLLFRRDRDGGKKFLVVDGEAPPLDPLAGLPPDAVAGVLKEIPVPAKDDLEITFLSSQKGGDRILVAGVVVETTTVPFVKFYSDGTCTPFRAQFVTRDSQRILSIDPWTCAKVLTPPDPYAAPPP
ncbi:MAG: hypothetical protein RLZZ15_1545 [Verrucomicrobiota bacterium]|jgi:general secretion pathway protein H